MDAAPHDPGCPGGGVDGLTYPAEFRGASRLLMDFTRGGTDDQLRGRLSSLGYRVIAHSEVVGHGQDDFDRSVIRLMSGAAHRTAGAPLNRGGQWLGADGDSPLAPGDVVNVHLLGTTLPALASPCLVLTADAQSTHAAMVYGTLHGHVECGEESFTVTLGGDGAVTVSVCAFSRPARLVTRLGGPAARAVQRRMTVRYVKAVGGIR